MSEGQTRDASAAGKERIEAGTAVIGIGNQRVGTVDAVFADYLLVRTSGLLPVDLYVPRPQVTLDGASVRVDASAADAYQRWHRPLKRAPHD